MEVVVGKRVDTEGGSLEVEHIELYGDVVKDDEVSKVGTLSF